MASSFLLEVACEVLERMTPEGGETYVQMVCNSCLSRMKRNAASGLYAKPSINQVRTRRNMKTEAAPKRRLASQAARKGGSVPERPSDMAKAKTSQ